MMTYWAVVGLQPRARLPSRVAGARADRRAAARRSWPRRSSKALQRQLHPHFLFNTLNTISALMHRDVEAADEMLVQLSDLLRLTLDRVGTQQVPLKDELDFLQKYLEIEQTRFGDRLTGAHRRRSRTLDAPVPNLLLQPLVENALRHGIGPKVGGGRWTIARAAPGDARLAEVRDNGVGLSPDKLMRFIAGVGPVQHPVASRAPLRRPPSVRVPDSRPAAGCS